jgi:hypothetical protein
MTKVKSNPNDKYPKKNPDTSKHYPAKGPDKFCALSAEADWHLGFGIDLTFEPWSPLAPPKAGSPAISLAGKLWHLTLRMMRSQPETTPPRPGLE